MVDHILNFLFFSFICFVIINFMPFLGKNVNLPFVVNSERISILSLFVNQS